MTHVPVVSAALYALCRECAMYDRCSRTEDEIANVCRWTGEEVLILIKELLPAALNAKANTGGK